MFFAEPLGYIRARMAEISWTTSLTCSVGFGFAMEVDPNNATVFTLSRSSQTSFVARRKGSWTVSYAECRCVVGAVGNGLPQGMQWRRCYAERLSADHLQPTGMSSVRVVENCLPADSGESWNAILESLPPVVCVRQRRYSKIPTTTTETTSGKTMKKSLAGPYLFCQ